MRSTTIGRWAFAPGDEPAAAAKGFDDTGWRRVAVPHDWSVEQAPSPSFSSGTGYLPGGVAWYRAHVSRAAAGAVAGSHVRLVLHGVQRNADVWVNGYHLGGRPSGFARFSFDLTELLRYAPDDDLVVSVRVDRSETADSRWYNGTGINRRVDLEVRGAVRVAEHGTVFETLSADATEARVRIVQHLEGDADGPVRVRYELRAGSTAHTATTGADLVDGRARLVTVMTLPDPALWSDRDPRLHRLTTSLAWEGGSEEEEEEEEEEVVGVRTIAFDPDDGFSINGERRTLRGVCLHEDAGPFGTAVPDEVWLRRLLALREMGANAVRMAHNPHAPELYALCDALGLLVIDEAFDEWENAKNKWWQGHNVYPPKHDGPAKHFPEWYERDLAAMVEANRNHPSVIAWSIGNEVDYPNDPYAHPDFAEAVGNNDAGKPAAERVYDPDRPDMRRLTTIARRLAAVVRARDTTRPVTLAAAFPELSSTTGLLDDLDLVGYNYRERLYAADHARFPHKPFVGSETSHRYVDWQQVEQHRFVAGQFLWTGVDYLGETRGWPSRGSGAGLLTLAGLPKPGWHLRRSWWTDRPEAFLATRRADAGERPSWERPPTRTWIEGEEVEVLCFAGGGTPRLRRGDEAVAVTRDEEEGWWSAVLTAGAEPLVLEVERDGEVVARDELRVAGDAARLDARVWRAPDGVAERLRSAGLTPEPIRQIECLLLDREGVPAADDRLVRVEVEGGALLGIENGDLADGTPYSADSRRTHEGRLVVFVRPGDRTSVTLRAEGVPELRIGC